MEIECEIIFSSKAKGNINYNNQLLNRYTIFEYKDKI